MGLVERGAEMQKLDAPRPGRSRDLFGVQLEVTSLLLEAERRKLAVLQRELQVALAEGGSVKVKEKQRQELLHAISKIQGQHEQLDKEYRIHAAGVLLCNSRGSGKAATVCGLGRILGYIGGKPSVRATMSQSGSGSLTLHGQNSQGLQQTDGVDQAQTACQNGRAAGQTGQDIKGDVSKKGKKEVQDMSNGFENRTMEYERYTQERTQERTVHSGFQGSQYIPGTGGTEGQPNPTGRRLSTGQPEDRHPGQIPCQQYPQEKDRVQYVSQTSTQTVPVQTQPQFSQECPPEQVQYPQIRSQFEVRSQMYPQGQFGERAGYVTRDVTFRDPNLYPPAGGNSSVFSGQGQYVSVQHQPPQSTSPQPPFYPGVVVPQQAYAQYPTQPQYPYSQYPQTVMNPVPYHPQAGIYPQQFAQQQSPNPQRFSQDLAQYQAQPIIQPIAQNVAHQSLTVPNTERPNRGPKPMVPPRVSSKITHDQGHRKTASMDVPMQKQPTLQKYEPPSVNPQELIRADGAPVVVNPVVVEGQERRYLAPVNQNPRTRQDGLYVDSTMDQTSREKVSENVVPECGLYVSRAEHRKSISVDVTSSFQRRNDTITFTFPGENQEVMIPDRKIVAGVEAKRPDGSVVYPADQQRRLDVNIRASPMSFNENARQQENRKSVSVERKPERGNVSPNQRAISQENRRSDYFEDHRRSPVTLDGKRMEDVRRSPMPFVPIRDMTADRNTQKSPSFVNPAFEKTRQELVIWAELRQKQEMERGMMQAPIFSTSPRSRNQSEERRDHIRVHPITEERKDQRMSQSAFQPMPNISQSTIMEQRRHLRHVSADLTKHMELVRKDFEDQPVTGSVANLGAAIATSAVSSQRTSPNLCHQYPALSEAKLDTKNALTVVTDFGDVTAKSTEQVDHIIHSHRKSQNASLLTHSKSQAENLQSQSESADTRSDVLQLQQQMQNQQSLDMISEKLSQFERQQSDLQARLQCLQNHNQILDKVAQLQTQQNENRLLGLQAPEKYPQRQSVDVQILQTASTVVVDAHHPHLSSNHLEHTCDKSGASQPQHQLPQTHFQNTLHPASCPYSQQAAQLQTQPPCEKLSPRLQYEAAEPVHVSIPSMSQMPLPNLTQFDRADVSRGSLQFRLCPGDMLENAVSSTIPTLGSAGVATFTGTLKKVPPEKPPRTSLIVQSPETESNRSQPAIGLKQTPKTRKFIVTSNLSRRAKFEGFSEIGKVLTMPRFLRRSPREDDGSGV
ncbi:uncharacterized protein LOC105703015 [Orussus abietinus]|uniref:uncharacterized protein LOC105703015 n=1 Tax=Orussus abietinus TaxID=222816 RepID=UPI0006264E7C|nr:uncharacterized protein LOC105703015 [Orussus abietinus]